MNHPADINVLLPRQSFIALIRYRSKDKALFVVLRKNGQRYKYLDVSAHIYQELMNATNRGSYIAQNVMKGPYNWLPMEPIPLATLEQLTHPAHLKYYLGR